MNSSIKDIVSLIASDLSIKRNRIENTISLLEEGATYPFIARYRKEATGGLNEVDVENIDKLYHYHIELIERKLAILKSIEEQGKLTDYLKEKINSCSKKSELEDLYLPYKPKRRTKATIAKEAGLTKAAELMLGDKVIDDPIIALKEYINTEHNIKTVDEVVEWAGYIIIEKIKEDADIRKFIRTTGEHKGIIHSKKRKEATDEQGKYTVYYDYSEPVESIPSHRYLAIARGEKEKILSVKIIFPTDEITPLIKRKYLHSNGFEQEVTRFIKIAEKQIELSTETEIRNEILEKSGDEAINVFRKNLETLLMKPPAGEVKILGIDPGIRTGSKFAMIDEYGNLLSYGTIYTEKSKVEREKAKNTIIKTVNKYAPEYISIGNGTYSREMYDFITDIVRDNNLEAKPVITNESGASIYSGSPIAREEFPELDITIRGAISIARRLQDPLSELVKIDPKSIGVGQYQHDVNQKKLKKALDDTVISCVNRVGVNANAASWSLLKHVSGFNERIAKSFENYRKTKGAFHSREEFKSVPYVSDKVFELSAGFLRIPGGENPLDASGIHPESYDIVKKMADNLKCKTEDLIGNPTLVGSIDPKNYVDSKRGIPTITDILNELKKPGRDPRNKFTVFLPNSEYKSIDDLKNDVVLKGIVTNVTNFGAFIDIGVHQDGLCHISEISNRYIRDISEVLHPGDIVKVRIIDIDIKRKRISLSIKQA